MPRHSNTNKHKDLRKPAMERKRRQKINDCLSQIKQLIPEAKEFEIKKGCRLEKVEILEIAVKFIRKMKTKMLEDTAMDVAGKISGTSTVAEECPQLVNTGMASTGPTFASLYDLSQDYDTLVQMPQGRVYNYYPPIFRPTPRFFTPLCVSSNTVFDPVSGESIVYQQQSVPLLKETEEL